MPKFKTRVVPPGIHTPSNGKFHVSRERTRHWADGVKAMRLAGIKIPVAWGHQPKAEPADEEKTKADREYWLSRYNAGYVDDADVEPDGCLSVIVDAPGVTIDEKGNALTTARLPDGREVQCAISEVSGAFRDWTDGTGKPWDDALIHLALTPLPVVANQEGFKPIAHGEPAAGEVRLSLTTLLAKEPPVADDNTLMDDAANATKKGEDEGADDGMGGGGNGNPEEKDEKALIEEASKEAEELGIHVPADLETCKDWIKHFVTAVKTHKATKGIAANEGAGAGGEAEGAGPAGGAPPTTESPPMMMNKTQLSLANITDPTSKAMFRRIDKTWRETHDARIARLAARKLPGANVPAFPKAVIDDLRKLAGATELSLTQEGEPVETELDRQLSLLERALPAASAGTWKDGAKPAPSPLEVAGAQATPVDKKGIREMAQRSGLPVGPEVNGAA